MQRVALTLFITCSDVAEKCNDCPKAFRVLAWLQLEDFELALIMSSRQCNALEE